MSLCIYSTIEQACNPKLEKNKDNIRNMYNKQCTMNTTIKNKKQMKPSI